MKICGDSIQNILVNMVLKKKNFKKTQIQKDMFSCLFIWEWVEKNLIWNHPIYETILTKLFLMIHRH
jgi:hypothetical protein